MLISQLENLVRILISNHFKYTSEKTSGGLSKHIQKLKDSLT